MRVGPAARIAISVAVFGFVLWWIDARRLGAMLANTHLGWFGIAFSTILLGLYPTARVLSSLCGGDPTSAQVLRVNLISMYFGTFLPGDVTAGIVSRIRYLGLSSWQEVLSRTIVERFVGLIAYSVLVAIALASSQVWSAYRGMLFAAMATVFASAVLGVAILSNPGVVGKAAWLERTLARFAPETRLVKPVLNGSVFAWSFVANLVMSFATFATLRSIGIEIGYLDSIIVGYLLTVAQLVPFFFAGIGIRDVSAIALLGLIGISPEHAVGFSTLMLAIVLLLAMAGGVVQLSAEGHRGDTSKVPPPSAGRDSDQA